MTTRVRQLLESFDQLPETERQEAATAILRRSLHVELPALDDEVLIQAAEELFLKLDEEEAAGERA